MVNPVRVATLAFSPFVTMVLISIAGLQPLPKHLILSLDSLFSIFIFEGPISLAFQL